MTSITKSISEQGKSDQDKINKYMSATSYQYFPVDTALIKSASPVINNTSLGCVSTTNLNMIPFDGTNLHTQDTAKHTVGIYQAKLLLNDLTNYPNINYSPGLSINTIPEFFNSNPLYFVKNASKLTALAPSYNLSALNSGLQSVGSLECFGYIKVMNSGQHTITISNPGTGCICLIWIGEVALTNYTVATAILNSSMVKTCNFNINANEQIPIRIQYGQPGTQSNPLPFSITHLYQNQVVPSSTNPFFYSAKLKNGDPWEPVQTHYSLQSSKTAGFYTIQLVNKGANSNFTYNRLVRSARSSDIINPYWRSSYLPTSTAIQSMLFDLNGNIHLMNGTTPMYNITNLPTTTPCSGGTDIKIQSVTVSKSNKSPVTYKLGAPNFSELNVRTGSVPNTIIYTVPKLSTNNKVDVVTIYTIGNSPPKSQSNIGQLVGSNITLSNQLQVNACKYTLTLSNIGDLIITNTSQLIWGVSKNLKVALPRNAIVNSSWLNEYIKNIQSSPPIDLSKLTVGQSIGQNATNPYLISANGLFKLTISDSNLILSHKLDCQSASTGPNFMTLYGIKSDAKIGQVLYANLNKQTISSPTLSFPPTANLKYTNTYNSIKLDTTNQYYPPQDTTNLGGNKYQQISGLNQADCLKECNKNDQCGYAYSYINSGNKNQCMISTAKQNYSMNPNTSGIKQGATLNIRNQTIKTDCAPSNNMRLFPNALKINSSNNAYNNFSMYSLSPLPLTSEGICGTDLWKKISAGFPKAGKEGFSEGASSYTPPALTHEVNGIANYTQYVTDVSNAMPQLKEASHSDYLSQALVNSNMNSLSDQIALYNNLKSSSYDAIDADGKLTYDYNNNNPSPNIHDVLLNDLNDNLTQQNLLYITGSITLATLIIAAIIISRN